MVTASIAERKVAALETASAKKSEKSGAADDKKKDDGSGRCYICGSKKPLVHRHCGLCKSLVCRTRDFKERGAKKGAMLAKLTVPAVPEVIAVAAMVGAARGNSKEEQESGSGARGRPLRSPMVTFYRWTGSEESR